MRFVGDDASRGQVVEAGVLPALWVYSHRVVVRAGPFRLVHRARHRTSVRVTTAALAPVLPPPLSPTSSSPEAGSTSFPPASTHA